MTGTRVFEAKKALFDRLSALAVGGQPLEGIQVSYAFPGIGALEKECVYGGGVRFTHDDAVAERGVLVDEVDLVSLYIRITAAPPVPVEETDIRAAEIFGEIAAQLNAQPFLTGSMSFAGVAQGQSDYEVMPDGSQSTSILALQARVETDLSYGGA